MNSLSLRASATLHTTLSPRLQRAVRLLQMSSQDFAQAVRDALDTNPFLEQEDVPGATDAASSLGCRDRASTGNAGVESARRTVTKYRHFCASSRPIVDAAMCFHILEQRRRLPSPVQPIEMRVSEAFPWALTNQSEVLLCRQLTEPRCLGDLYVAPLVDFYPVFVGAVRHTFFEASSTMPASLPVNEWQGGAGSSARALQTRLRRADKLSSCTAGAAGIQQRTRV
ncbi:MAG: hypothetical protein ABI409_17665 [Ramlibacter sp.]